jgi:very-short-patch-repair endonuclease
MLIYNPNLNLKSNSQRLRSNLTDAENLLWSRLRRKQILSVQFYRQKPIGNYIVDFYAPAAHLVIEADGGQHFEEEYLRLDSARDAYMAEQKLNVLRFDNVQILQSIDDVLEMIFDEVQRSKIPPTRKKPRADPLLQRG